MERWSLPNLEVLDVPEDLSGNGHAILCDIASYMKNEKPIKANETLGGNFVNPKQHATHLAVLRDSKRTSPVSGTGYLRILDLDTTDGFPSRLFAAHLLGLAQAENDPTAKEHLIRRAIEIFPGDPREAIPDGADFNPGRNYNNYCAFEALGDLYFDLGKQAEAVAATISAVSRCPQWGREFAEHVRSSIREQSIPLDSDPRFKFWAEIEVDVIVRAEQPGNLGGK